jgi:hypothetical protein
VPYKIKDLGGGKFKVVNKETGKEMSKEPQTREKAESQLRALYANMDEEERKQK